MHKNLITLLGLALLATACTKGGEVDSDPQDTGDTAPEVDAFVFATDAPSAYSRVDRIGMPAINTAVIASKDAYNQADPADDANGDFVEEIVASVTFLHEALDDDLIAAGLTPCAVDDCIAVAAPLVVPDTLKVDVNQPAGFPNGRTLTDPVIDVTLAVVLLDLAGGTHGPTDLVGVNPTENDLPFSAEFPYLAEAH